MVILLQINKITFERSKNLEKILVSQNLAKILTENCSFFFFKKKKEAFFMVFLKLLWRK